MIYDYQFSEAPSAPEYRATLEKRVEMEGIDSVFADLKAIDPESAERIHPNNVRRVIRALEIYHCTGYTMSEQLKDQPTEMKYDTCIIGLTMEREQLYARINHRVDVMVEEGLVAEVQRFFQQGLKDCQSIQAIGYKELYDFFNERVNQSEAIEYLKQNSRRYAKRQLTWFRNKMNVSWFDMTNVNEFVKKIDEITEFIAGKLSLEANKYN